MKEPWWWKSDDTFSYVADFVISRIGFHYDMSREDWRFCWEQLWAIVNDLVEEPK